MAVVNVYRALHNVPNMTYSKKVEDISQTWASFLANNDILVHSSSTYGENLAMIGKNHPSPCNVAVDRWYKENQFYDYSQNKFDLNTGHFSQLVWKNTNEIGVGIAASPKTGIVYVAMLYNPPGNVYGLFAKNVYPKFGSYEEAGNLQPQPSQPPPNYPPTYPQFYVYNPPTNTQLFAYNVIMKVSSRMNCQTINIDTKTCTLKYHKGSGSYYDLIIESDLVLFYFKKYMISTMRKQFYKSDTIALYDNDKVILRVAGVN